MLLNWTENVKHRVPKNDGYSRDRRLVIEKLKRKEITITETRKNIETKKP